MGARFSGVSGGTVPANTNVLVATTLPKLQKSIVDNFFLATPLLMWLREKGRTTPWDGGDTMEVPIMNDQNPMAEAYQSWQDMDVKPPQGITVAVYGISSYRIPLAYSRKMAAANRGESAIVNLIQTLKDQAEKSLIRHINTDLFRAADTSGVKMLSLYSIFEETVQTAQAKIVGGISKATYNTWWSHPFKSVASTAAGILAAIRETYMLAGDGADYPDVGVCDEYTYMNIEDKLYTAVRFVNPQVVDWGFENIMYRGVTLLPEKGISSDAHASDGAGTLFLINSKYLKLAIGTDANFRVVPPEYFVKQDIWLGAILVDLQLYTTQMRRHAVVQGGAYAAAC
jgi:hypothetical protein